MNVLEIQESFGLDRLVLCERPEVEPGAGEVLLEMQAASINYRDLLMVRGHYNPKQPLPLIPCSDGVGEVLAVGSGVETLTVGDRVATLFCQQWIGGAPSRELLRETLGGPLDGTLAERMILPAGGVVKVPAHLSNAEAATLSCAGLTAWSALVTQGNVGAGDTVLVLGTGGVSLFALQFAQLLGARVIVTSSSHEKLARAQELGAWAGINYVDEPQWARRVLELTDGRGVDHVVEVGGTGTLNQSAKAVRVGGSISLIGVLSGTVSDFDVIPILMQNVRIQGVLVGHRNGFEQMLRAIDQHQMKPVVDRQLPWTQAPEALAQMAAGKHFGKICLSFDG